MKTIIQRLKRIWWLSGLNITEINTKVNPNDDATLTILTKKEIPIKPKMAQIIKRKLMSVDEEVEDLLKE